MHPRLCDKQWHAAHAAVQLRGFSQLNEDVFRMIVAFADPPDAKQLAKTCRVAYRLAMPRFLSNVTLGGPDVLDGPKQIIAFANFMLADAGRVRHLRALELREAAFVATPEQAHDDDDDGPGLDQGGWVTDYTCALRLADVLHAAPKLHHLAIWDLESLLSSQPSFAETLRALPRLQSAVFWNIGRHTMQALKGTASLPRRLEFGDWKDGARVPGDLEALYRYAPTLESFTCRVACLLETLGADYRAPRVREMVLGGRIPHFGNIARAFPGLRRVTLLAECSALDVVPAGCWTHLDHVETWLPLPFFACKVRRLELHYAIGAALPRFARTTVEDRTLQLLAQTTPNVLTCTLAAGITDVEVRQLVAEMSMVRFLELTVNADAAAGDVELRLGMCLAHFSKISLEGIFIRCAALSGASKSLENNLNKILTRPHYIGLAYGAEGVNTWPRAIANDETTMKKLIEEKDNAALLEALYATGVGERSAPSSPRPE